jgi:predicted RNA binding protein YcfA (HicA-like mRNA interferase family)
MKFPPHIWSQLKNKTADELISALERDGAKLDITRGARQVYRYPDGRRVLTYSPPKRR